MTSTDLYLERAEQVLGPGALNALARKRILCVGVGGVGSWCAEALVRSGAKRLTLMDDDVVQPSNLNRQLPATLLTMGRPKVEALRERLLTLGEGLEIVALQKRYVGPQSICLSDFDYVIDAIDSVEAKASLCLSCTELKHMLGRPLVYSSMGAALRRDPTQVRVSEFWQVKGDGLARALRNRYKKSGAYPLGKIRCVHSTELPAKPSADPSQRGSLMPVTATFGLTLASLILEDVRSQGEV